MALNRWIGNAVLQKQTGTLTVGGPTTAGNTIGVTINGKTVSYTLVAGDTLNTAATGLSNALRAAVDGEFQLATWAVDSVVLNQIDVIATTAGVPYTTTGAGTLATTTSGGSTLTYVAVQSFSSPNDVNNTANWSAGTLPATGDDVLVENTNQGMLWNLSALVGVSLNSFKVRDTFAPTSPTWVGLALTEPNLGFREFRGNELTLQGCTTLEVNLNASAPAGAFSFNTGGVPCALKVTGSGPSAVEQEAVSWRGSDNTATTLQVYGGSVAVRPLAYSSSGTASFQTAQLISGTLRLEGAVTVNTSVTLTNSILDSRVTIPTLTAEGSTSQVTMRDASGVTTLAIDAATVSWLSSGTIPTLKGGGGGTIDFSGSYSTITLGSGAGTVTLNGAFTFNDPEQRTINSLTPTTLLLNRTGFDVVTFNLGEHFYLAAQKGP